MPAPGKWLLLEEARLIVAGQGFRRQADYYAWKDRPADIPSNPRSIYGEDWRGWEYFLGIGPANVRSKPKTRTTFLEFEAAKKLAQQLMPKYGIASQSQWHVWVKTADKPAEIPADPSKAYKDKGWVSWPDWLGRPPTRASGRELVRPFSEAREFTRSLDLKSDDEWRAWAKTNRPDDIPYSPDARYRDEGWIGWGDFLGYRNRWTHREISQFLDSLEPCIEHLTELDLYVILSKNGMLGRDVRSRGGKLLRGLKHARTKADLEVAKQQFLQEQDCESKTSPSEDERNNEVGDAIAVDELPAFSESSLRTLDIISALQAVDRVKELELSDDADVLEFLIAERVSMLWQEAMANGPDSVLAMLGKLDAGLYATTIKERFVENYQQVATLAAPECYRLVDSQGQLVELNLMQRLTAFRLMHEKRLGNWSGVGAGKTNAAIFASAVLEAKFTVILVANATVAGWKKSIEQSFPAAAIHLHCGKPLEFHFEADKQNYLVVNYESFQRVWTPEFIEWITAQTPVDFIILDEVQFARQRHESEARKSRRRKNVDSLIAAALRQNPDVRILAMSATPVVNNLREAVKVLQLLWPERDFSQIPVGASIANAIGVHLHIRQHGIRFVPQYEQQLIKQTVAVDGQAWLPRLEHLRPKDLLPMEQTLMEVKIRHLGDWVRRGTLIYTQYVEGIFEPVTKAVEQLGLRVLPFSGEKRVSVQEFVEAFKAQKVDVLIGSAPVGTGVDGLQFVLDRILFLTLPWSHAEYEQIVGRLWRQGSPFHRVEVLIPQVTLREERAGQWSWDDLRLRCIEYKQTLADAVVDGVIPRGGLPSRQEMQRRSLAALKTWKDNVSKGLTKTNAEAPSVTLPFSEPVPMPVP